MSDSVHIGAMNPARDWPLERCAGLMFGFLFHGGRGHLVNDETLAEHADDRHDWIWLHLALADHRARRFLEHFPEMAPEALGLMLSPEDRIQVHLTPNGAFGILPEIERDFADQSLGAGRLVFWFDGKHLVTARHHPVRAVEQLRDAILAGEELGSPAETVVRLQEGFGALVEHRLA
ncbi:MAG TPA: CorA family divalent cation transporter, partial [Rhizomicrobium sp.]|nr:CorA family divalent cation transporter [Rhizomicrobium sp.]